MAGPGPITALRAAPRTGEAPGQLQRAPRVVIRAGAPVLESGKAMESTRAPSLAETDGFARAAAIADRFVANIETVVHGKREEVKLVLAALLCGGHVLFEDVPGTAK